MKKILLNYIDGRFYSDRDRGHIENTSKLTEVIGILGDDMLAGDDMTILKDELQVLMKQSPFKYQFMLIGKDVHCIDRQGIIDGNFTTKVPDVVYLMLMSRYDEIKHILN